METEKIKKAIKFSSNVHSLQRYDTHDYTVHLAMVAATIEKVCLACGVDLELTEDLICAGWLHDVMEDSGTTYNDLKEAFGEFVAELVYGCTCEKGRTRKDRFNEKFYSELRKIPFAYFVKGNDRLCNMVYSKTSGSSMYQKYCKELPNFTEKGTPTDYINDMEQTLVIKINSMLKDLLENGN